MLRDCHDPPIAAHEPHEQLIRPAVVILLVNALSSHLTVRTHRDGVLYSRSYERGVAVGPVEHHGPSSGRGTVVTFMPDPKIFAAPWVDAGTLSTRLRELSWLHPPLQLTLIDQRRQNFHAPQGAVGAAPI